MKHSMIQKLKASFLHTIFIRFVEIKLSNLTAYQKQMTDVHCFIKGYTKATKKKNINNQAQ